MLDDDSRCTQTEPDNYQRAEPNNISASLCAKDCVIMQLVEKALTNLT